MGNCYQKFLEYIGQIGMASSEELHGLSEAQRHKSSDTEVSYAVLSVLPDNAHDVLEKFATTINVQLSSQPDEQFPFIPFNGFDKTKEATKSFLYGSSGCGKSRGIYELVKERITNLANIFIINPRHTTGVNESGRTTLGELFTRFNEEDAVVWDNFPEDMPKTDLGTVTKVLEELSSKNVKTLLIGLRPKYLEVYRDMPNKILELYVQEINYEKENFKSIIKFYGDNVRQFKQIYKMYIINNIDKISKILWHKEPTPLTILDYYKELISNNEKLQERSGSKADHTGNIIAVEDLSPLNAIREAERLLRPLAYYQHQFAHIISLEDRQIDAEFLYILKLCYDLGLSRSPPIIEQLQTGIFGSRSTSPQEQPRKLTDLVFRRLTSWVYLSGQYYAMHDVCKDSIKFNDYINMKITNYLTENLTKILPNEDSSIYLFGMFLGRNIQFIGRDAVRPFVPTSIYNYMKSNRFFETGFGRGTAESFLSLDDELQKIILNRVELDIEFARGLGDGLGRSFASLDEFSQQQIIKQITSGLPFARFLGESLGRVFHDLPSNLKEEIFAEIQQNVQFADGIGMGIGYVFRELSEHLQKQVFERAEKNSEFTRGLGYGMALNFLSFDKEFQ
ncbi:MAG TPA: hypothetical protein VI278_10770, partial [Nitrososphaeraceae archaeon]